MPITNVSFLFGRLNVLPAVPYENRIKFLTDGLNGPPITHHEALWSFLDVQQLSDNGTEFIFGYLVKYRAQAEREVVEEIGRHISTERLENAVDQKARFILYPDSMIVAFNPVHPGIAASSFIGRFVGLFEQAHGKFFVSCEIQLIQEEYAVLDAIRRFDRITRVKVKLHPSNPSNRDLWRAVDDDIKSYGASEYEEEWKAAPHSPGLTLKQGEDVRPDLKSKILMAGDGYGEATVRGFVNQRPASASTSKNPVKTQVARTVETPTGIAAVLRGKLQEILGRFRQ